MMSLIFLQRFKHHFFNVTFSQSELPEKILRALGIIEKFIDPTLREHTFGLAIRRARAAV